MIEWLDLHSGSIQALATFILVGVTAYYAYQTRRTVQVMKANEERDNRPRVIVYMKQREEWLNLLDLIIINLGKDIAQNVKFIISEDILLFDNKTKLSSLSLIKNGVKNLIPKQKFVIPFISLIGRVNELQDKEIRISATYEDVMGVKKYKEEFTLDFNGLLDRQAGKPPANRIADSLESISKNLEQMERDGGIERMKRNIKHE